MWDVVNHTPFAVEGDWARDLNGAETWLVAVRAAFDIQPNGSVTIASKQPDVCSAPVYSGKAGHSSLLFDSDLYYEKLTTDIILHGHAYTPYAEPSDSTIVRLRFGELDKSLRVVGDRWWRNGLAGPRLSPPEPFSKMPLVYERAFGGGDTSWEDPERHVWDFRNPVGTGFATQKSALIGQRAPNILAASPAAAPGPFGFGPIAGHWIPRRSFAGTHDRHWQERRFPLAPEDFDPRFYQCAPTDQQYPHYLEGGEDIELDNLTPDGHLRSRIPRIVLGFETDLSYRNIVHEGRLHTVILEPDRLGLTLVWHTNLPCHADVLRLRRTTVWIRGALRGNALDPP